MRGSMKKMMAVICCGILPLGGVSAAVYAQEGQEAVSQEEPGAREEEEAVSEEEPGAQEEQEAVSQEESGAQEGQEAVSQEESGAREEEEAASEEEPNSQEEGTVSADVTENETDSSEGTDEKPEDEPEGKTASKDETVYILAGADGAAEKIIVSDWLKNPSGEGVLEDLTELADVENVKGDESFTAGTDGALSWDAQGNDIYYQGNIEKDLPVTLNITYLLDGEEISPSELAGKSGKVTIRFDYSDQQSEKVEIGGKEEQMYVPFAVVTGAVLDNNVFRNVEVSNGKLFNDGSHTAVVGIAFPGMQDNLAISREDLEIPEYVEITGDAENFQLGMTVTLVSNELFSGIDTDRSEAEEELSASMEELTEGMDQLLDGSSQLCGGLTELLERSGELSGGVDQLSAGAKALEAGAGELDKGTAQLQEGSTALYDGLNTLISNNDALNGGAEQVFAGLLATADSQLAAAGLELPQLTADNYAEVLDGVISQLQAVSQDTSAVAALKASLDSYHTFYQGLQSYTAGVAQAAAGAEELQGGAKDLKAGTEQLSAGAGELSEGILTVKGNMPALTEGITQLKDGAQKLSDGLEEFDRQGIQKLTDAVNGDLKGLAERIRAMKEVSENYDTFAGISENMDGRVRFIYRTDSIG